MWQFLKGYVILQIEGTSVARFLRRLADNGIVIRNLYHKAPSTVRFEIEKRRYFELHRLKKGLPVRIRIIKRKGVPFVARRMKRRPVLWIGTMMMLIAIPVLSARIWMIRIDGAEHIDRGAILELLKEHGLSIGSKPKGPVLITAANDLSVRVENAAWIGLDREGITLKVSVVESLPESEKNNLITPSDMIADKDGIVTGILVLRGQARVKVGDRIRKGDVLISGTVQWKDAEYQTRAIGRVTVAVDYDAACEVLPFTAEIVQTDRSESVRSIRIGPWTVLESKPGFDRYRITESRLIHVTDRLPVFCEERTAYEMIVRERALDEREAEQIAFCNAREAALHDVPKDARLLNQYGMIRKKDGKTYAVVIITAEETIGRTEDYPNDG